MSTDERTDHPLVHALRSRDGGLADQAMRLIRGSSRFLEFTLSTFPGGTDHTHRHTRTVEKIGRMILSDEFLSMMTGEELFFLALACHYHDLAMAGSDSDDKTSETRDQVRRDHAIRIGDIVVEKWAELGFDSPRWARILGEVCRGHRPKKNDGVANWEELSQTEILGPGISVRVRLVSALIYAIDELHLGADRAPERVENWRNIQDEESRRHWRRHQAVSGPVQGPPLSILFQVSADTPGFEENLRSQVFRKAFAALDDLRRQASADGITAPLPSITIEWQRQPVWDLLLAVTLSDLRPRSREEITRAILDRFHEDRVGGVELEGVCKELGNADSELEARAGRAVSDAVTKGHLVPATSPTDGYIVSSSGNHVATFFERTRRADDLDLMFLGRYRASWEQALFASELGRCYIRNSVFPVAERAYSVRLSQRPANDPIRILLESCPTASRMVRDYAPASSNLVKESLLIQVALTGALIDMHSDPERLLEDPVRSAVRALAVNNETVFPTIRLLEELALIGGFTQEQLSAAACPSEAAQEAFEDRHPPAGGQIHIHMTQSLPAGASGATQLPQLLLASHRAGTPILLTSADDHDLALRVEGDHEIAGRDTTGVTLGVGPAEADPRAAILLPARIEVNRTTRTIRLYMGQFSPVGPTAYPVIVRLPAPPLPGQHPRGTFGVAIQWPELTVRDLRALDAANQAIRSGRARIEMILEEGDRLLGSMDTVQGSGVFASGPDSAGTLRALRGVEGALHAPLQVPRETIAAIANMTASARSLHWQGVRANVAEQPRISSVFLRMTTADGRPYEERFLRFFPFSFFPAPTFEVDDSSKAEEVRRQWDEAESDFLITGFFCPDVHELKRELVNWFQDPSSDFPFRFMTGGTPEPVTRSKLTVRLLRSRDRIWHRDRPIIFEFRPVDRRESYEMEAAYWQSMGDSRRERLAREICDREPPSVTLPGPAPTATEAGEPTRSDIA